MAKIGILREENDVWERRTPLIPSDCKELSTKYGYKFILQPSNIRCYVDSEYESVGCEINEDLSSCSLILGIQTPPIEKIEKNKTFMFFPKAKKGQISNQILDKLVNEKVRLIDYESIKRKIDININYKNIKKIREISSLTFSRLAGVAGTANIFKGLAELLLSRKFSTPFIFSRLAHMYSDVEDLKDSFVEIGKFLKEQLLPQEISPFVVSLLGSGAAAAGVLEVLTCLPHELVTPFNLPYLTNKYKDKPEELRNKIFISIFDYKDLYILQEDYDKYNLKDSSEEAFLKKKELSDKFDINHFYDFPEVYHSVFKHYLPYVSCIINAVYWKSSYHRILRKSHITHSFCYQIPKLLAIADISCDLKGSIEILDTFTTFQEPFFVYEPMQDKKVSNPDNATMEGIIYHANPKLACCLPLDASNYFSNLLKNYIPDVVNIKYDTSQRKSSSEMRKSSKELLEYNESKEIHDAIVTEYGYIKDKYRACFTYSEKNNTFKSQEDDDMTKYFLSLKLRGHIFDNQVFKKIIDDCCIYNVVTQMGFTKIGDNKNEISCLYITYYSNKKDNIIKFDELIDLSLEKFKIEKWIVKSNFK